MSLYYDQKNDTLIAGMLGRGIFEISGFAKSLGGIQLTVTGDQLATITDTLTFNIDAVNTTLLDVQLNTEPQVQFPFNTITKITVNLLTGNNNVILDFKNGDPIPLGVNTFTYTATTPLGGVTNALTVNDAGTFTLSNSQLNISGMYSGTVGFPVAGNINDVVFNPPDVITATNTAPSTYNIGGSPLWTGNASITGEAGQVNTLNATLKNNTSQTISLADYGLEVAGGELFNLKNVGVANVTVGTAGSYLDVSQWSGTGLLNGLGSVTTPMPWAS